MERLARYRGNSVIVRNLDNTIDDQRLRSEFAQYGHITSAQVIMDGNQSSGYGIITFNTAEEAARAVQQMNGATIGANAVECSLAQEREDRDAYLASLHVKLAQQMGHYRPAGRGYIPVRRGPGPTRRSQINSPRWITQTTPSLEDQAAASCSTAGFRRQVEPRAVEIPVYPVYGEGDAPASEGLPGPSTQVGQGEAPTFDRDATREIKEILGAKLLPIIQRMYNDLAHRITNLLLEHDIARLIAMLENYDLLKACVEEAAAALRVIPDTQTAETKKQNK